MYAVHGNKSACTADQNLLVFAQISLLNQYNKLKSIAQGIAMTSIEPFIISFSHVENPQGCLNQAAEQAGVQLSQVEDIYWAESVDNLPFAAVQIKRGNASLQQAIHSAMQCISANSQQIVAAGGAFENSFFCLILCSPAAIGRLNLSPLFRIAALGFGPQAVEQAISRAESQPSDLEIVLTSRKGHSLPSLFNLLSEHPT